MRVSVSVLLFSLLGLCQAAEQPLSLSGPQGALLVLPPRANPQTASAPAQSATSEDLSAVNERTMERLAQEAGAQRGAYHVYLADGRLQKVQYTTAPLRSEEPQPAPQSSNLERRQEVGSGAEGAGRQQGVYYVEVPEDRYQAFQAAQSSNAQFVEQTSSVQYDNQQSSQIGALSAEQRSQEGAGFFPLQVVTVDELVQARLSASLASAASDVDSQRVQYSGQYVAQDGQYSSRQEEGNRDEVRGYVASVQYSEVDPIRGPVYSYSPEPLVRILRYAPQHL